MRGRREGEAKKHIRCGKLDKSQIVKPFHRKANATHVAKYAYIPVLAACSCYGRHSNCGMWQIKGYM